MGSPKACLPTLHLEYSEIKYSVNPKKFINLKIIDHLMPLLLSFKCWLTMRLLQDCLLVLTCPMLFYRIFSFSLFPFFIPVSDFNNNYFLYDSFSHCF